ncbi:MAG TPA: SCO family protein [Solirubrobacteraceae bacterium]|nr:SCO family protein [Solirubrobacteraceae bacterium]
MLPSETTSPQRARVRTLLAAGTCAAVLGGCGGAPRTPSVGGAETGSYGAALPGTTVAPPFTLAGQRGQSVSLAQYRGRVVALTFLYTTCGGPCFLIAQQMRGALDELAAERARAPVVLIVSADPATDTPRRIARFLRETSLAGRAQYLTGSAARLRAVWRAYRVRPASAGRGAFAEYASVLLIDGRGRERVLFQSEQLTPEGISREIARLEAG